MSKGLPRSHARGSKAEKAIVKDMVSVNTVVAVSATGVAVGFGSAVVHDFPAGNILLLGCVANLSFSGSGADANLSDTWSGDFGLGTAANADVDLADAGDDDIIPSQALDTATAEVHAKARYVSTTTEQGVIFDNTDGSLEVNLNLLIDAADITDDQTVNITAAGEIYLAYIVLGDD